MYINELMLLTKFGTDESPLERVKDTMSTAMIYDMLKVLAFGILLLELEMLTSMEAIREEIDTCALTDQSIST